VRAAARAGRGGVAARAGGPRRPRRRRAIRLSGQGPLKARRRMAMLHRPPTLDPETAGGSPAPVGAASGGLGIASARDGRSGIGGLLSGTVTFLFTDIEGSTRLLELLGERYPAVLDEHRQLLRSAFQGSGGREVDVQG